MMIAKSLLSSLLSLAGCGQQLRSANAAIESSSDENHVLDVIIIGAGWAGIGAADYLSRHSDTSFLVLESTGRTGGRTEAAMIGDDTASDANQDSCMAQGVVIELGSMWMPGSDVDEDYGESIISRLAYESGLVVVEGQEESIMNLPFMGADGMNADQDGTLKEEFESALECVYDSLEESTHLGGTNLRDCGWNPTTHTQRAFESGVLECSGYTDGRYPSWDALTTSTWGEQRLVTDQQSTRGFARLLDVLGERSFNTSRIRFNSRVERIEYNGQFVTVSTKSRTFQARQVISTIPLGVLQRQHEEIFSPPLSNDKQAALITKEGGVRMVNVTKVYIQFPNVWWDDNVTRWVLENEELTSWRNMNHKSLIPGSNILLAITAGSSSSKLEALNDEEAKNVAMNLLQNHFPNITIPSPSNFVMSRHGTNENRFGAFSVFDSCGSLRRFYNAFVRPLRSRDGDARVRFAGEAHCPGFSGYVHGALLSGIETAASYLYETGIGPDPKRDVLLSMCSDAFKYSCPEPEQ